MAEAIKNYYNTDSLSALAEVIKSVYPEFDTDSFMKSIFNNSWGSLELKGRTEHIATILGKFLPTNYREAIDILDQSVAKAINHTGILGFVFTTFVGIFGQTDKERDFSIATLGRFTIHSSAEFEVRWFIINHEEQMMAQMYEWAQHENEHLRRLASEGCRPALPWASALPKYKQDPTPILPILETLKADPSLYVRKSVANNLNDISKTHPELVITIAKKWYGDNVNTNWIVKHACRTLLKKGNPEALAIFGYHDTTAVDVQDFKLSTNTVAIGNSFNFSFKITALKATKLRLEYGIDFMKANRKRNRKIFQISESELKTGQQKSYNKKHSFADLSTRKHYPGLHVITLIVNGTERATFEFELTN